MNTRPAIIVVLGHVDHGKTTLLDYIRKTNIAAKEPGQITQHIGAYQIEIRNPKSEIRKITFIDTPGHEAFEKMRSRGASVADIAVLVVAADDGVMPQTKEAIRHINKAKIPMIVAINKIDVLGINLEKIKKQLVKEGILLEGYGGDVVSLPISAKTGQGIDDLLEMILLVSEMEKPKGDANKPLEAVVIESRLDRNRGPVADVVVINGTLRLTDEVFVENIKGRIRALINDKGEQLKEVFPGTPAEVSGLEAVPPVGAIVKKEYQENKEDKENKEEALTPSSPKLKVIIKADVAGTLEAILASLKKENLQIISSGIGDIGDSDVLLAKATGAIIIGFNVKIGSTVIKLAEAEKVKIKTYQVIYELLEEITEVIKVLSAPEKEESLGKAEIIAEFPIPKGKIAGCKVLEGRLALGDRVKVLRNDKEIGSSRIKSLRHQKETINKAELGKECGVVFGPQLDFSVGDIVISEVN